MSKQVILTGIRANNDLTIGNYFGAIMPMVDMAKQRADEFQINMFVPDLHSFTTPIDHDVLQEQIMHNLRLFVAAGLPLDKDDIHIYRQSYIPAHSELTWILNCFTGFGHMLRMTQFKEKSGIAHETSERGAVLKRVTFTKSHEDTTMGLFDYPVLMAADILLYGASYIPVGEDQTQHLEFTRDIAERMNSKFDQELFTIPKSVKEQHQFFGKDQGLRIKDLQDPTKKMSKSDDTGKGVIFLGDDPEVAYKKIMSATTDSVGSINLDLENQPGITNLLQILSLLTGKEITSVAEEWQGKTSYGEFKTAVAEATKQFLEQLQTSLSAVDDSLIKNKLESSEETMKNVANQTLFTVQKAVGLR
jgi:tryptophanyl-tRNA synthetase